MSKGAKWLDRSLVVSPYYIGLCRTAEDFERECKRLKVPKASRPTFVKRGSDGCAHFFEKGDGSLCAVVCIAAKETHSTSQINALLVHESVHIWQEIRREIGEAEPSAEFEAYSVQAIAQRLMEAYWGED